jgi:hypothetical protein
MTTPLTLTLAAPSAQVRVDFSDGLPRVTLHPRQGEREWTSPLLSLEVLNRMEDRVDVVRDLRVMHAAVEDDSIHVVLRDILHGVTLGIWLEWQDDELSVLVPPAEIEEARDALYLAHSIMVLPALMQVGADGQLLLPVNAGVLCAPGGKPKLRDRFLIYGEQERWELVPMLPVCGVQSPAGGLVCLARQGATDAWCAAATDGAGTGTVAMGAMFRRQWIDPVNWEQREFRYRFLPAGENLVLAAADRVRRHVVEDFGKPTLAQRAAESPECAYQQGAYTMKLFHGMQLQGIMTGQTDNPEQELLYKRVLSFKQAEEGLRKLKAAGVERAYLQSVGWNPKGHDGAWPTDFPIDRRLGGEAGLRALIGTARELGFHITTHLNCAAAFCKSPDFASDRVIHDIWGQPKIIGFWGGGVKSTHWGLALPEGFLEGRMHPLKELGFNGMQYLDGIGNPLYVNYHPVNGGGRRDHAAGINRYLDTARRIFGAVATECGFLYCAAHADALCAPYYHPFSPWPLTRTDWPIVNLIDRQVPVWQLAMHDLVTLEQQGVGWKQAMNGVLFGRVMRDEWAGDPGFFPVLDDVRVAQIKAIYDLVTVGHGHLVTQRLTHWEALADQVEQTRFEDGTEVVADFHDERLWVNGQELARPAVFPAAVTVPDALLEI